MLIQPISAPQGQAKAHFTKMQEAVRKDVERAFGVLQARFAIVRGPARFWNQKDLHCIMSACIILHNMIVEDERDEVGLETNYDNIIQHHPVSRERTADFETFLDRYQQIRDHHVHLQLRNDLIEHLWAREGAQDL
jgi:Plant transposon protein